MSVPGPSRPQPYRRRPPPASSSRNAIIISDDESLPGPSANPQRASTRERDTGFKRFSRAPDPKEDREALHVEGFETLFTCPVCELYRPAGEAKVFSDCGHILCGPCMVAWAETRGEGPAGQRTVPCPICRTPVRESRLREIEVVAARYQIESELVQDLAQKAQFIRADNQKQRALLRELKLAVAELEHQLTGYEEMKHEVTQTLRLQQGVAQLDLDDFVY